MIAKLRISTRTSSRRVEGRIVTNDYRDPNEGHPVSKLEVRRNYETVLKSGGWVVVYADPDLLVEKQTQNGREQCFELKANGGDTYTLVPGQKGRNNVGAAGANQTLSEERAKAVVAVLVARGIGADRLSASGFGQTKPVADNATEGGRAQNRRVELVKK